MTKEQSIAWLKEQLRWAGGWVSLFFWGFMAFFLGTLLFVKYSSFLKESYWAVQLVMLWFLSVHFLVGSLHTRRLRAALNALLGESWDK